MKLTNIVNHESQKLFIVSQNEKLQVQVIQPYAEAHVDLSKEDAKKLAGKLLEFANTDNKSKTVDIRITENQFEIDVNIFGKRFTEKHTLMNDKTFELTGNLEDELDLNDKLYFKIEQCSDTCCDIVEALNKK